MTDSSNNDVIAQTLNITPLVPTAADVRAIKSSNEYETAKSGMEEVIHSGSAAIADLADLARLSQDPRVYRVLAEVLSTMVLANKGLMEIKKMEVEIDGVKKQDEPQQPTTVNQHLHVGTTQEMIALLKSIKLNNENDG